MPPELLAYHHPAGYLPLREAIASYLATARGVRCTAEQVMLVTGSQQGIDLAARVLLDPGEEVWMEDPGYPGRVARCLGLERAWCPCQLMRRDWSSRWEKSALLTRVSPL
jgi:DNA-binding transcriptional MocR family regulator